MFLNENRNRYYGLRVGDIIEVSYINNYKFISEVIHLCEWDNNAVMIKDEDGKTIKWVAEWCKVVTKVEDRVDYDPRDTSDESTKDDMQPEINEPIE